jgi:hypothetical protein
MKLRAFFAAFVAFLSLSSQRAAAVEILDWAHDGGHTYYLLSASDWMEANFVSARLGGDLVTIDSVAENTFLQTRFADVVGAYAPANTEPSFWIGLRDRGAGGAFVWETDLVLGYSNWAPTYPKRTHPDTNCVSVDAGGPDAGLWKDSDFDGVSGRIYFGIIEVPTVENLTINPPAGLLSWWPGENTAWDVAGPAGGSMKNAATGGQAAYAPGKVGMAFSLDGVNDRIDAVDAPGLDLPGDFTIEAWIRHRGVSGERAIISKRDPDNLNVSYTLFLRNGTLRFASRVGGGSFSDSGGPAIPANQWVHVAVTATGTQLRFYKDGIFAGGATHTTNRPDTTGVLTIGGTTSSFSGEIDELSLYSRALTDAEIDAIFWVGPGGKDRHDPARDFSATANPNGPWSFDYFMFNDPTFSGTFPAPATVQDGGNTYRYAIDGVEVSLVRNFTNRHVTTGLGGTEISASPRQFFMNPGVGGMGSGVRWTAPEAGRFAISGTFTGSDAKPTSTRLFLYRDNTTIFPAPGSSEANTISSYLGDGVSVTRVLDLEQGDEISWLVDANGNNSDDNTGAVFSVVLLEAAGGRLEVPTWEDDITTAEPPMTGRNWRFHARNESRPEFPDMTAWIQYSATPDDPDSWIDLGQMETSGSLRFILDTSLVPVGSFAFRIKTSVPGIGTTYSQASPIYDILEAAPFLEMDLDVSSRSDPSGETTHRGDALKYTLRFRNTGSAPYEALKARIVYPRNTTANFPAHLTLGAFDFTLGGQRVSNGEDFAWEWNIPSVRPVGQIPYGEARNTFKTVTKVVKGKKKKSSEYDKTFFSMPNDPSHGFENGDVLRLHQYFTTALPTGLEEDRDYFVVNATAGQFQIAATAGGAPLQLKTIGTRVAPLHFERTNEWQTRTISFGLADPTPAQELAQANAGLPPINAEGAVITARARVLTAALSEVDSVYSHPTEIVNPLSLTIERVFENGPVEQGDLVTFNLIAKNKSSQRLSDAVVVVTAPVGLGLQGSGDHPVFLDANGVPAGPPINPATNQQVVRPASWTSNPELREAEIPGPDLDSVPTFEQQARFYFGAIDPGTTRKARVTCRVQYDWDTVSDPVITFDHADAVFAGAFGAVARTRLSENTIDLDVEASTGSGKPKINVWVTQNGMGVLTDEQNVATVAQVDGLARIPQVPDSVPSRGINEIVYEATYANFGGAPANYVRLWMPIPENTEVVRANLVRTITKFKIVKKKGKKKRVPYTVRIPYTVGSEQVSQGADDNGEILSPQVVGGGTWFTCLVPSLRAYPNPGWSKTVEIRVKVKTGVPVGTRIEQLSAFATSRDLFLAQEPVFADDVFRALVAEVRAPAELQYFYDQTAVVSEDAQGNPDGFDLLADRAICVNRGGVSATGAGLKYIIPHGFKFRSARYVGGNAASTITKPAVGSPGGSEVVFNIGTIPAGQGKIAEVLLDYDRDSFPDEDTDPTGTSRGGMTSARFLPYDDANPLVEPAEADSGFSLLSLGPPLLPPPYLAGQINTRAIFAGQARPFVGIVGPSTVRPNTDVTYRIIVGNHANSGNGGGGFVHIPIPVGATYVSSTKAMEYNGATIDLLGTVTPPNSGAAAQLGLHYPNGSIFHGVSLAANSCVVIDFTIHVDANTTGNLIFLAPGFGGEFSNGRVTKSPISCPEIVSVVSPVGTINQQAVFESQVGAGAAAALGAASQPVVEFLETRGEITENSTSMSFGGTDYTTVAGNNIVVISLGANRMVAAGGGDLISDNGAIIQATGSALVAAGAGNMVAAGAGNLISIDVPTEGRLMTGLQFVSDLPRLWDAGSASIFNGRGLNMVRLIGNDGSTLIGNDGSTLIGNDGSTLIGMDGSTVLARGSMVNGVFALTRPDGVRFTGSDSGRLVAAGAGNLVAAGAGNVVPTNAGNLVAAGAGNLVAAGAGNLVAAGGLNLIPRATLVAAGAGNVVPTNGGGLVAAGGLNLVAAGAGNMVAAGAGNVVVGSAGLVAAGAGN